MISGVARARRRCSHQLPAARRKLDLAGGRAEEPPEMAAAEKTAQQKAPARLLAHPPFLKACRSLSSSHTQHIFPMNMISIH